ncbi:MAG: 4Fe-4S dicluster domain-containing protein [Deltaproteobacteria bacterium]|nr:4Fe-4S dicluster domain-containing protein [Deltaproteobacteria bacterium]
MKEIVVISGKGGTGKTSIVAGLAQFGPDKVLADCDVDAADLHLVLHPEIRETHEFWNGEEARIDPDLCTACGLCHEHCRFGAIEPGDPYRVKADHCEGCGVCAFVCPSGAAAMNLRMCGHWYRSDTRFGPMIHAALGIGQENSGKLVTTVRKAAHDLAEDKGLEMVLVDGSPGIGCPVIASLTNASAAVIVAEPTVSAFHDMRRVHELTAHFKIPAMAVLNKSDINPTMTGDMADFCEKTGIAVVGRIPYDLKFTQAQVRGLTAGEYDSGLEALLGDIWQNILHRV